MKATGIENDQQYEITKDWIARFEATLAEPANNIPPEDENSRIGWELCRAGLGGIVNTLRAQLRDYESRQSTRPAYAGTATDQESDAGASIPLGGQSG